VGGPSTEACETQPDEHLDLRGSNKGAVDGEPDEEVLALMIGAAGGQAVGAQALADSANIVDLRRAVGRRHSAGAGGRPGAESERPHSPPLIVHHRPTDEASPDRCGTESGEAAEDEPRESRASVASDELVLNAFSALAEFERIEGVIAPLDVAAFRRSRAQIARLSTAILGDRPE